MPAATVSSKLVPNSARDRLLDVALELFATRGYQAIGLRDLASQLGLHAGSLYNHIENKQCLLFELIEGAVSDLLADTKRRMRGARTHRDRLQRFVHAFVVFNLAEKHRLLLVTREFVNLTDEQQREINQLKSNYAALLSTIISAECDETGRNAISDRTGLITEAVIGMLYGQSLWQRMDVPEQKLTDILTHFVLGIITSGKDSALKA
ncbi:TetR/AcrR family transcriptional regulator [Pseudomonas sp. Fig-3]|uniref:TetR/AcrR family transcriptional regulator n=1 Tax=unclassified Pseudomonas TaxID=196821 RepID=UPI0011129448|nr:MULTISPECIES: TetR/AcrR family transcriptional regulator [unclassified Pseudomonas]TNB81466.1 TetR/AcrR family transcriptional regulator [Pseudomonas sp. Fig-3]